MRLLHVTDVLPRPSYSCDPWYLQRGKAVHLACHYLDTVGLDWEQLDPRIEGYVRAWERCKKESAATVLLSEAEISGPGYVGTLDRAMSVQCNRRRTGRLVEIWDLKCGPIEPWHGLQTAAYLKGLDHHCVRYGMVRRRGVHLSDDGTYRLVDHNGRDDLCDFLAYLRVAYYEIQHGLREWPALREGETA